MTLNGPKIFAAAPTFIGTSKDSAFSFQVNRGVEWGRPDPDRVIPAVKHFLEEPEKEFPLATAQTGYHTAETR